MRTAWFMAILAGLATTAVGHSVLPLSYVTNGTFEDGFNGWIRENGVGHATLTQPGAEGSATAVTIVDVVGRGWVKQPLATPVTGPAILLDWSAMVVGRANAPCFQTMRIVDAVEGGQGLSAATFFFIGNGIAGFSVWNGAGASAPMPTPGVWHHYQIVLLEPASVGVLLVDGVPAAVATGDATNFPPQVLVAFGDTGGAGCGPAPDVAWDEIYVGPLV